jgi:ribosomal protein S18 acetylase RimI-like enzyme
MNILAENNQILFQRIQPSDIEQTATCIYEVFTNFELITKALKISFAELHSVVLPICKKAVDDELSIIAKGKETGEVVGFIISEDFITVSLEAQENIDKKFEAYFYLLSELEENYRSRHPVKARQVLHISLLGVQEKYTKKNIATTLVRENLSLAKHHNFETAIAEATAAVSQHIFRNLGFTEEFAIEYKSYKFKGEQVLSSIENPPSCLLMSSPI